VDSINRDRDRHLVLERAIADADAAETLTVQPAMPTPASQAGTKELTPAQRLAAARSELQDLELRLKPGHPDVVRARKHVAELQEAADREALAQPVSGDVSSVPPAEIVRRNRLAEMKAELANLDQQIDYKTAKEQELRRNLGVYQGRIEATPTRESELADLTRDYTTLQSSYRNLLAKKQDSQISANLERRQIGEQFRILDAARLPARPESPNRPRLYGLGVVAGLGAGLAIVVLLEYLDRTMKSESDVRAALTATVLATIPLISPPQRTSAAARTGIVAAVAAVVVVAVGGAIWYLR
jgi:uncharacterized protein involved in exopolysaccharide biosynthesis